MGNKSSASVHKYVQPRTVIKTVDDVTKFSASEQSAQLLAYIDALTASAHCTKQYKCDLTPTMRPLVEYLERLIVLVKETPPL